MIDLRDIGPEHFEPFARQPLSLHDSPHALTVELVQRLQCPSPRAVPFSVVFRLDPGIAGAQGVYRLDHPQLGPLDVFLVPIEPRDGQTRLEAVFN